MSTQTALQILVLDFGSQYTQLIARRLREYGIYTEIVPYFESIDSIKAKNAKGIILSGGPASVYEKDAYKPDPKIFELGIPVLGICYGMQYIADFFGGKVVKADEQEFGKAILELIDTIDTSKDKSLGEISFTFMPINTQEERNEIFDIWKPPFYKAHDFMPQKVLDHVADEMQHKLHNDTSLIGIYKDSKLCAFGFYEKENCSFACFIVERSIPYQMILKAYLSYLVVEVMPECKILTTQWDKHDKKNIQAHCNLGFQKGDKHDNMLTLSIQREVLDKALNLKRQYNLFDNNPLSVSFHAFNHQKFPQMLDALVDLWEDSIRASHHFLNEDDISELKDEVKEGLKTCEAVIVASNQKDFLGFIAGQNNKIEMLFVAQKYFNQGIGKRLIYQACVRYLQDYENIVVDCNTQNTQAINFYTKLGFQNVGTSMQDSKGRDFPTTHFECSVSYLQDSLFEPFLDTQRTYLRHFTKRDLDTLHTILSKKEVMYAWGHGFSEAETQEWLQKQFTSYRENGFGGFAVIDKTSGKLIGNIGFNVETISLDGKDKKEIIEIAYILDNDCWGRGIAVEVADALKTYAFKVLGLNEVYALIKEDNFTSMKVARKIGMRIIGENIKNYKGEDLRHYLFYANCSELVFQTEYIPDTPLPIATHSLFNGVKQDSIVWMSHADKVEKIPEGFIELAKSGNTHYCAIADEKRKVYALQFHPEVVHSEYGGEILRNFALDICGANANWNMHNFAELEIKRLRDIAKEGKVLCAVSGGVDSSVVATLLYRAIGENLIPVFVDTGLLRLGEKKAVEAMFRENLGVPLISIDASNIFLSKLKGVTDPEVKRKIIGETFIEVFEAEAKKHNTNGEIKFLAQGTLYPDVIESVSIKGPSKTIKSHHNVGGLPDWMKFELIEPLRELFKDEVRSLGRELGMPESMLMRHPFPGPGLAIRIMGEVNREDLDLLRASDAIFIDELHKHHLYNEVWQAFCVLLNVKSVGVMGDNRTYDNTICIRAVEALDGMTATFSHLPHSFLEAVSNRIINEVEGINRVVYDITSKPPGTIEWE